MNTYRTKHGEICSGSTMLCCPLVSLVVKATEISYRAHHWKPSSFCCMAHTIAPALLFLFLDMSQYLRFGGCLDGVKLKQIFCLVHKKTGETGHSLHFLFPGLRNSFKLESFLLILSSAAWGMKWCRQNEAALLSLFVWLFSGFLFHYVAKVS